MKTVEIDENEPVSLEQRVKHALANPRGDALMEELMLMYVYKPVMSDDEIVTAKQLAHRAGKQELVLMLNGILNDEDES